MTQLMTQVVVSVMSISNAQSMSMRCSHPLKVFAWGHPPVGMEVLDVANVAEVETPKDHFGPLADGNMALPEYQIFRMPGEEMNASENEVGSCLFCHVLVIAE